MFIDSIDLVIKAAAITGIIGWQLYWNYTERIADREKPKTVKPTILSFFKRKWLSVVGFLFLLQLFGYNFLPFERSVLIQLLGLFFVLIGISIAISARKTLSTNWTHAVEYQIKKNHELVTQGVYSYIRHPIYAGLIITYTGMELILHSYLFLILLVGLTIAGYFQGKREEKLLLNHFGKKYEDYMKRTKMLFPYIL